MVVIYEKNFDANEWFILISLVVLTALIIILPKIFTVIESLAYILYGICISTFFDHTISTGPWDFYDVNDKSSYQFTDFLSYLMFGPYSYLFLYFYKKHNIQGTFTVVYIILWSVASLIIEWVAADLGVFHYGKGYKMYWSFPIYLAVQIGLLAYYHVTKKKGNDKIHL